MNKGLFILLLCILFSVSVSYSLDIIDEVDALILNLIEESGDSINTNDTYIGVTAPENISARAKKEDIGSGIGEILADRFNDLGYHVVDRNQMEEIMDEYELILSGMVDEEDAVEIGSLVGANVIATGSVTQLGNDFNITIRLISVESSEVIASGILSVPIESLIETITVYQYEDQYPISAMFRSMIPGWGQFYNNQPAKGTMMLSGTVALVGAGVTLGLLGMQDYELYQSGEAQYVSYYETALTKKKIGNYLLIGAAVLYTYNLVDAYFVARKNRMATEIANRVEITSESVSVALFHYTW